MQRPYSCFIHLFCCFALSLVSTASLRGQTCVDRIHERPWMVCPYSGRAVYDYAPTQVDSDSNTDVSDVTEVAEVTDGADVKQIAEVVEEVAGPTPADVDSSDYDYSDYGYGDDEAYGYSDYDYSDYEAYVDAEYDFSEYVNADGDAEEVAAAAEASVLNSGLPPEAAVVDAIAADVDQATADKGPTDAAEEIATPEATADAVADAVTDEASTESADETEAYEAFEYDSYDDYGYEDYEYGDYEYGDYDGSAYEDYGYHEYEYEEYGYEDVDPEIYNSVDYNNPTPVDTRNEVAETVSDENVQPENAAAENAAAENAADHSLYDLTTSYDPAYNAAMAVDTDVAADTADDAVATVDEVVSGDEAVEASCDPVYAGDPCYGGYCEYFAEDYRCGWADDYDVVNSASPADPLPCEPAPCSRETDYEDTYVDRCYGLWNEPEEAAAWLADEVAEADEVVETDEATPEQPVATEANSEADVTATEVEVERNGGIFVYQFFGEEDATGEAAEVVAPEAVADSDVEGTGGVFVYQFYECDGYLYYEYEGYDYDTYGYTEYDEVGAADEAVDAPVAETAEVSVVETIVTPEVEPTTEAAAEADADAGEAAPANTAEPLPPGVVLEESKMLWQFVSPAAIAAQVIEAQRQEGRQFGALSGWLESAATVVAADAPRADQPDFNAAPASDVPCWSDVDCFGEWPAVAAPATEPAVELYDVASSVVENSLETAGDLVQGAIEAAADFTEAAQATVAQVPDTTQQR